MKKLSASLKAAIKPLMVSMSDQQKADFRQEQLEDNFSRLAIASIVMSVVEFVLFFLQEYLFNTGFIMIIYLLASCVLIPLIFYIKTHIKTVRRTWALVVMYAYAASTLMLGAALALFVLHDMDVTHVYLMTVLGVSLFLSISPVPLAVLFASVYAVFALALPEFLSSQSSLLTMRINTLIFNLFAWLLGQMSYRSKIAVFINRRQLHEQNRALEDLAQRDAMTGLYHHAASLSRLKDAIRLTWDNGRCLCLIMTDIDDFKAINDTYGHQFGDDVISRVAAVFSSAVGSKGIVGRYGGEEFVIILPDAGLTEACALAENIQSALARAISQPRVTVSGGISLYHGESLNDFIRQTDERLYLAKNRGKHLFVSTPSSVIDTVFRSLPM